MKVEIPEFRRCCYCIPLRYGLIVWGYVKLVLTLMMFLFGALVIQMYMQFLFVYGMAILPIVLIGMSLLLFLMVDIGMTIVFLFGGHRKATKPMRIFYIYSLVLLGLIAAFLFLSTVYDLCVGDKYDHSYRNSYRGRPLHMSFAAVVTTKVVTGIAFLGVQVYTILLVRSEINKLENSRNFRFTNVTTEGQCNMENKNNASDFETHAYNNGLGDVAVEVGNQSCDFTKPLENKGQTFDYNKF